MRITEPRLVASSLERLTTRLQQLEQVQRQLASGRRVVRPSDDPASMGSVLSLRAARRAREQEARNAADGETWVRMTDAKLQEAVQALRRARDLAVRGASSLGPGERQGIATELLSIRDVLVAVANSKHQGQGLFAGTASAPAVSKVGGAWTYTGDAGRVARRIGDDEVVIVNLTADEVFGFAAGQDVFSLLEALSSQVAAGDTAAVDASIPAVDAALGRVLDGLARIGAAGSRIEAALVRNQEEQLALVQELSKIEDADLAEAVMELQLQEVAYRATLSAMARTLAPSLVDFLR